MTIVRKRKPYFMTNKEWYRYDDKEEKYVLTDKAPQEAIESYNEFYKELDSQYIQDSEEDLLEWISDDI